MNFKNKNITGLQPVAILKGGIYGIKLIVKVQTSLGESYYSFLVPPLYHIGQKIEEYLVEAAIAKYEYEPLEETINIVNEKELKEFIEQH